MVSSDIFSSLTIGMIDSKAFMAIKKAAGYLYSRKKYDRLFNTINSKGGRSNGNCLCERFNRSRGKILQSLWGFAG